MLIDVILNIVNQNIFEPNGYSVVISGNCISIILLTSGETIMSYANDVEEFLLGTDSCPSIFDHINWLKTQTDYLPLKIRDFARKMPEIPKCLTDCSSIEELRFTLAVTGIVV